MCFIPKDLEQFSGVFGLKKGLKRLQTLIEVYDVFIKIFI